MQILVPVATAWTAARFGDAPGDNPADPPLPEPVAASDAPDWAR